MQQFFKFLFASCLGTFLALFLLFFVIAGGIGAAVAGKADTPVNVEANSVLHLKLATPITELTGNTQPTTFELDQKTPLGVHDMVKAIEKAKTDDNIKGIFLEPSLMEPGGFTTLRILRRAIEDFKADGKFVYAYAPVYTQGAYYLSTVSDELAMAPLGVIDFRGFSAQYPFYKDMLDRIGVAFEVFYAGEYKSASEPYRRNSMSDESREQTSIFLNEMYSQMLSDISESRDLSIDEVEQQADTYAGLDPDKALAMNMVDQIIYREAFLDQMREALGLESGDDINTIALEDYYNPLAPTIDLSGEQVAVLVAEGVIVDGKGDIGQVGDKTIVKLIEELKDNDEVKAVVLRVNSPGGSAMASDHMWQALMDLKASGKPLVVSMGSVAASGGYYIAAPGDHIYAEPSTITGSIGVVSAIPQFQEMLTQKLGVHFDSVGTGPFATGINPVFDMSPAEKALLEARTDQMYSTFLDRVSEGRGISKTMADSLGRGRVWVGTDAYANGLVDDLGDLDDAIAKAVELADLSDQHGTVFYPEARHPWDLIMEELTGSPMQMMERHALQSQLGSLYPYYEHLQQMEGMQMRMPYMISF